MMASTAIDIEPASAVGVGASASGTNAVGGSVGLTLTVANVDRVGAVV